jgi:NADPH:quinone reductase-like Zn-dependent oxidoreductase
MRALILEEFGVPLRLVEIARPVADRGQVLVRIKASGANPLELKIRTGASPQTKTRLPAVLGLDLAGIVESVGRDVTDFKPGDEVYGMTGGVGSLQGSLAEFAAVDADLLAKKPSNYSMREAAALPMVFLTAWEGLVDKAKVQAGQNVLVNGGAGGVGHVVVQIALAHGAQVFATDSAQRKETIEKLGATAINYQTTTMDQCVAEHTNGEGFDIIYDTVGGPTLDASFGAVRPYRGHVVSCAGMGVHKIGPLSFRAGTYSGVFTLLPMLSGKGRAHHGDILRKATKLAETGKLRPLLDSRHFGLETTHEAHEIIEAGTASGKIVIDIAT